MKLSKRTIIIIGGISGGGLVLLELLPIVLVVRAFMCGFFHQEYTSQQCMAIVNNGGSNVFWRILQVLSWICILVFVLALIMYLNYKDKK